MLNTMRPSIKIALIYTLMGILWILLSDNILLLLFHKTAPGYIRQIQTYKGIFYVLLTGVLLYYLVRHYYNQLRSKVEELTELNKNLAEQKRQLELSNKELEQFSYIVSHDLQEPLRMISSFATRISEKYDDRLDQRGKQYLQFVVGGATKIRGLILDLLEYSHATQQQVTYEKVSLNELLDDIRFLFRQKIADTQAEIIVPQDLPTIISNKTLLQLILQNMIDNGLKYRDADRTPIIRIGLTEEDGYWQFCITDNGKGIEPEYLNRIFTIFYRLQSDEQSDGNGMGLAIVKKIIEKFDGRIWVQSVPGSGSSFYFTVPIMRNVPKG